MVHELILRPHCPTHTYNRGWAKALAHYVALAQLSTLLAPMMQACPGRLINFNGSEIDLLLQVFIFLSLSNSEPQKQAALESISPLACQLTH